MKDPRGIYQLKLKRFTVNWSRNRTKHTIIAQDVTATEPPLIFWCGMVNGSLFLRLKKISITIPVMNIPISNIPNTKRAVWESLFRKNPATVESVFTQK